MGDVEALALLTNRLVSMTSAANSPSMLAALARQDGETLSLAAYSGKPASRKASVTVSLMCGAIPTAADQRLTLKPGSIATSRAADAFARQAAQASQAVLRAIREQC